MISFCEVSESLNEAQVRAAPRDNPGVRTTNGYLVDAIFIDSKGAVITGEAEQELLADSGIEEYTLWMNKEGYCTWRAPVVVWHNGQYAHDTMVKGDNGNSGRREARRKESTAITAGFPVNTLAGRNSGHDAIAAWIKALDQPQLDAKAFYSLLAAGRTAVPLLNEVADKGSPIQEVRASELLTRIQASAAKVAPPPKSPPPQNRLPQVTGPRPQGTAQTAPAAPATPVRVGGNVPLPVKTADVKPVYPAGAQSAGVQDVVIVEILIGPDGRVHDARILRSIPLLDEAALHAVRQWQYAPTKLNGVAVPVLMTVTVTFR